MAKKDITKDNIGELYEIDHLDRKMLEHLVRYPTTTDRELAKVVNLSKSGVNLRRNKPAFRAALNDLLGTVESHLQEAARLAARKLRNLVQDKDPTIAMPAVKLALSNHLNRQTVDLNVTNMTYKTKFGADGRLVQDTIADAIEGELLADGNDRTT